MKSGIPLALVSATLALLLSVGSVLGVDSRTGQLAATLDVTHTTDHTTTDTTATTNTTTTDTTPNNSEGSASSDTTTTDTTTTNHTTSTSLVKEVYAKCPFVAAQNRHILDLTHNGTVSARDLMVTANGTKRDAGHTARFSLPEGVYTVRTASYVDHTTKKVTDLQEKWRLILLNEAGKRIAVTSDTHDVADDESKVVQLLDRLLTVDRSSYQAIAIHAAYPSDYAHAIAPLCVAFDRVADVTTSTDTDTVVEPVATATTTTAASTTAALYPHCPLPQRDGRIIVDFTQGGTVEARDLIVRADGAKRNAVLGPVAHYIPKGIYDVRLASYDPRIDQTSTANQIWRALLLDGAGTVVVKTPPSRDVPDWQQEFESRVAKQLIVTRDVVRVLGLHAAYPSTERSAVVVLCASFDRVDAPDSTSVVSSAELPEPGNTIALPPTGHTDSEPVATVGVAPAGTRVRSKPTHLDVAQPPSPVTVADTVPVRRQEAVQEGKDAPFTLLQKASRRERATLLRTLLAERGEPTATSSATERIAAARRPASTTEQVALARPIREATSASVVPDTVKVKLLAQRAYLKERETATTRDTDGDGISDADEEYVYGTDPHNPFTGGGVLSDGERVLLGLDPTTDNAEAPPVESPKGAGETLPGLFQVDTLTLASSTDTSSGYETADEQVLPDARTTTPLYVAGHTRPLAFVTLYVFSTPIVVTVRADGNGTFEYTLDETLADGAHELYVASVNTAGNIIAKSEPIPFVKTAQAVERTPVGVPRDPVQASFTMTTTLALFGLLVLIVLSVFYLGFIRTRPSSKMTDVSSHED